MFAGTVISEDGVIVEALSLHLGDFRLPVTRIHPFDGMGGQSMCSRGPRGGTPIIGLAHWRDVVDVHVRAALDDSVVQDSEEVLACVFRLRAKPIEYIALNLHF